MNVEITIKFPSNCDAIRFPMSDHQMSALLDLLLDALEAYQHSMQQRIKDLEDEFASESDILSRLGRKLTAKQAQDFKRILRERHLSEKDICKKYGADSIEDLTGSDALDVIARILLADQVEAKIHENFDLLRKSVEDELKNNSAQHQPVLLPAENVPNTPQMSPAQQNKNGYRKPTPDAPASPKQIKFLLDLARQYGISPDQIKAKFNVSALESLTKTQCSHAIDELNGKAA